MPPRLHSTVIRRHDLLARLDEGLTKKLTLVAAPTGFGKTTLVRMWMHEKVKDWEKNVHRPSSEVRAPPILQLFKSAWVTLDENDNDPVRFWTYVITALRTFDTALGRSALAILMASQPVSLQAILTPLINDLARLSVLGVLVLEDYHTITSAEINDSLAFLLQHMPESLHLILVSRNEPDLPLAILRARDELVKIGTDSLRLTTVETGAFLRETMGAELPGLVAARLHERTEGWVAGLRLAALSLQNKSAGEVEKFIQTFSGEHRYVADYLIQEVFENQPEAVQRFLLKTCFLNRLTGSLCDAITEAVDGATRLEHLKRENLFIMQLEHGGGRVWYRYDSLFAESIQYLAHQQLGEEGVQSIFEKASDWYEVHGLYDEAIEAALAAKRFKRAMQIIEKFIEIHDITELHTLVRWLEKIPAELLLLHPEICLTYAQVILYSSDRFAPATAVRMEPLLRAAEGIWRAEEKLDKVGRVLSLRGTVSFWQGDFAKSFEYARQSLELLPEHDVFWRGVSLLNVGFEALQAGRILIAQARILEARALLGAAQNMYGVLAAIQLLGDIYFWQGEMEQAEQLNQQILVEAIEAVGGESMLDDQGIASLSLANIAYEQNDLENATQFVTRALELSRQRSNEILEAQATIRLAYIHVAKDDWTGAHELVKSLTAKIHTPSLLREIQNAQVLLSIWANDIGSLKWWLSVIAVEEQNVLPVQKEREAFTLARLRIAEGNPRAALEALDGWQADAAENGRVRSQVEVLCLEALAHNDNTEQKKAGQALTRALSIGQQKDFRRLFLDEGTRMAALLQTSLPMLPSRSLARYTTILLHSFSSETINLRTAPDYAMLVEPLSQQEGRVLRLLVAGLSNPEIARELVVSNNTIKTQVQSIYRKLNVSSREGARDVARELKLV